MYNLHLGLINALPPDLLFSLKRPCSLFIDYQKDQTYTKFWPRLYESDGRYQGVILGIIHFLSKRDPPNKCSVVHIKY